MNDELKATFKFLEACEGAKNELRHSWTSKGRQESVAEHSWRLCLMILVFASHFPEDFDLLKALKMALLHDIGEVVVGDLHFLKINATEKTKRQRYSSEKKGVSELCNLLKKDKTGILKLWQEFESNRTKESQVVNCFDKLEVCIQHCQADISTWTDEEKQTLDFFFSQITTPFPFIKDLKETVYLECLSKANNGISATLSRDGKSN